MYLGPTPPAPCWIPSKWIAKRVADALPFLNVEQVYEGVDYGKKGVDVLAKTVIDQVCTNTLLPET